MILTSGSIQRSLFGQCSSSSFSPFSWSSSAARALSFGLADILQLEGLLLSLSCTARRQMTEQRSNKRSCHAKHVKRSNEKKARVARCRCSAGDGVEDRIQIKYIFLPAGAFAPSTSLPFISSLRLQRKTSKRLLYKFLQVAYY